jgi:NhaA family Na+:H+ antiporter
VRDAVGDFLREETTTGKLLLAATALALLWANLAGDTYRDVWEARAAIGPGWLHLDLSLADWAADGLLAIFFFIAGLEVKRELVVGELSSPRAAALPLIAAAGGMLVPALVAIAVSGGAAAEGGAWAIPVATDIAFALGVLALAGASLPSGVRVLLLSMAVIDDVGAIALVAVLFSHGVSLAWLAAAAGATAVYALSFRLRLDRAWLLWALAVVTWVCMHASGVHATVAGIALGLLTPVRAAPRFEHRLHPFSAGFVVPVFALAAAGIPLAAAGDAVSDEVAVAVFAGLLLGKVAGIFGGARLAVALGLATLPDRVAWGDVLPVAMLGGIGYTVSLLIARLAFDDAGAQERAAAAVLAASVAASLAAVVLLRRRARDAV